MIATRVGRNDLCPCGSGRKFKRCCLEAGIRRIAAPAPQSLAPTPTAPHKAPSSGAHAPNRRKRTKRPVCDRSDNRPEASTVKVLPVEVGIDYTYAEPYGVAEVSYTLPACRLVCLENKHRIFADALRPGMKILLGDDTVGTITDVELYYQPPDPPVRLPDGLCRSRVIGTIKHVADTLVDVSWPGMTVTGTPDHPFYSVSRQTWVAAGDLRVGEFLRTDDNLVAQVEGVSKPRFGRFEVYNIEVEHFHTYYVGNKGSGVLVHNGGCINGPKQVAGIVGFTRHGMNRAIERGVKPRAILDALKRPLKIGPRKVVNGLPSVRYFGRYAEVVVNPDTFRIVSVNPMDSEKLVRILRQLGLEGLDS